MQYDFSFWITLLLIAIPFAVIMGLCAYFTLLERKIAAWTQDRIGPNRVGPLGLLQPIADGLKFLLKEQVIPNHVDKLFYMIAPAIAMSTALLAFAVVPFGPTAAAPTVPWPQTVLGEQARNNSEAFTADLTQYNRTTQFVIAPHVDIGLLFVFAVSSLTVYGVVLGGWSSNSKYSFLGSLRSSAQLISYEIPMGMSVLGVFLVTGSLNVERIIAHQYAHGWNILFQPLACLIFVICIFAECNRVPFDLPECEQELVGGYHTEYSAMKLALFLLGEYVHMITTSFLAIALYFGGWMVPGLLTPESAGTGAAIAKVAVFAAKMFLFVLFFMVIRWTIPRFRFDQLMGLAWKVLLPLSLAAFLAVMLVQHYQLNQWWLLPISLALLICAGWFTLYVPQEPVHRTGIAPHGQYLGHPVLTGEQIGP